MGEIRALETKERSSQGSWLELKDPYGELSGIWVKIYGCHSPEYRRAVARQAVVAENNQLRRTREGRESSAEDYESDYDATTDLLVEITSDWKGAQENGEELPFTRENVRRLYENAIGARGQVLTFARDPRRFLSASSSAPSR